MAERIIHHLIRISILLQLTNRRVRRDLQVVLRLLLQGLHRNRLSSSSNSIRYRNHQAKDLLRFCFEVIYLRGNTRWFFQEWKWWFSMKSWVQRISIGPIGFVWISRNIGWSCSTIPCHALPISTWCSVCSRTRLRSWKVSSIKSAKSPGMKGSMCLANAASGICSNRFKCTSKVTWIRVNSIRLSRITLFHRRKYEKVFLRVYCKALISDS